MEHCVFNRYIRFSLKLFVHLLQVILSMSSETIMLGITDREFQSGVVDFCQLLLRTGTTLREHLVCDQLCGVGEQFYSPEII